MQRILERLRDRLWRQAGRGRCPTAAIIDSQSGPAAGVAPRSGTGWAGGKRTTGVKRHIVMDANGLLLAVVATTASIQDRGAPGTGRSPYCAAPSPRYGWCGLTATPRGACSKCAKSVLNLKVNTIKRKPGHTGFHVQSRVSAIERTFAWLNKYRRCIRGYEAKPEHHEGRVLLATVATMTRRHART